MVWLLEYQAMLSDLARDLNPARPGRYEPRVVQRRPKPFARMQQPRQGGMSEDWPCCGSSL